MKRNFLAILLTAAGLTLGSGQIGCNHGGDSSSPPDPNAIPSVPVGALPGHDSLAQDDSHKEGPRLLPAEVYIRMYLDLFGGLSPLDAEAAARGTDGTLFDHWSDYLASLGLPDYEKDIARVGQTNAIMVATFERLGLALCDRAVERDLRAKTGSKKVVFAFDLTPAEPTDKEFADRFDVLHRTFLGYPAVMAETPRISRFLKIYRDTVARHVALKGGTSSFTPTEAGWAAVCHGLVRHPELHTY